MKNDTAFVELSRNLSENDRADLLIKINKSLNITNGSDVSIHEREMDEEETTSLLHEEINILPVFLRFFLWLRSKITGHSEKNLYLASKINKLKRKIHHQTSNLTGFETRNLTPHFAEEVYKLYIASMPLRELFMKLWLDTEISKAFFLGLIEERLKNRIEEISDLIEIDELVEIYGINGKKDDLRRQVILKLDTYISTIDKKIFYDLELELRPFYYLKDLILFPYVQFFQQFGFTPIDTESTIKTRFKNASALLCLSDLEKLYCALYTVSKLDDHRINLNDSFIEKLADLNDLGSTNVDQDYTERDILDSLTTIIDVGQNYFRKIPLSDLIRYFKKNPFFKVMFYLPKIDLKEFYKNTLKIKILDKIELIYPEIQKRYIVIETERLFKDKRFSGFQHYREYSSIDYEKLSVSAFSQIKTLELVYNYIACFYKGYIQETIHLLERGILSQNRLIRESVLQYAAAIEDTEENIKDFDKSLSPDSEDGKMFNKFRFSMAKDPIQQKMYRKIVVQKDREAKSLSELGLDSITGIKKIFNEVLKSKNTSIVEQLNQHLFINNKPTLIKEILSEQVSNMLQFEHLYHHVINS